MLFTEFRFLVFFGVAFAGYWLMRRDTPRKLWLLAGSYVFYGAWNWRFLGLIAFSTLVDYVAGCMFAREKVPLGRRFWMGFSLVANLGSLGIFKYYDFFARSAADLFDLVGMRVSPVTLGWVLPVGISFYTFQTLSYTIDVYRGQLRPTRNLLDFALFVAFFPQLVAGPIVRALDFLPQLQTPRRFLRDVDVRWCLILFVLGYVKKAVVADNVALVVDAVFAAPQGFALLEKWLGLVLYAIQIYCDFSGYTDMAIAVAGLFGYQLVKNFDFPYLATSITDFWRRWHISLSTWFRDYLYIPLGGSRMGRARTYRNLVTVFFLCGLWHGASWNFVIWGLFHGLFLVAERVLDLRDLGRGALRHAYVVFVVLIAWVPFRAQTLAGTGVYLSGLFVPGAAGGGLDPRWWLAVLAFAVVHPWMQTGWLTGWLQRLPGPVFAVLYGAFVALVLPWAAPEYTPFIYFQF